MQAIKIHAEVPSMTPKEINRLLADAKGAFGSASPERLGRLIERLVAAIAALVILLNKKDDELSFLRTQVFGSTSEKGTRAADFFEETGSDPEIHARDDTATSSPGMSDEEKAALAKKVKKLRQEARRLARLSSSFTGEKKLKTTAALPDEVVHRPVPADLDLECPICGEGLSDQGVSHRAIEIDALPSSYIRREYLLHKGRCSCRSMSLVMPGPDRGVTQTIYSPTFVARLIYDKFRQHLPFYRQARAMATQGLKIHRDVLIGLALRSWTTLSPVVERIREINRAEIYQRCDESPIRVVIDKQKQTRYLWCLLTDKAVSFEITERRNKTTARAVVGEGFGVLTSDRLGVYRELAEGKTESGCMAHCRRKFWYALPAFPDEAMTVIRIIADLYAVEADAKSLSPAKRLAMRKKRSVPILERLRSALSGMDPPPRSALGEAIKYTTKHWQVLTYFTKDGRAPIDNNATEGALRDPKLGWKNFLFTQSELGCEAVAGFYTLMATCLRYDIDPVEYLADVLAKLNRSWKKVDLDELLPWNWQSARERPPAAVRPIRVEHLDAAKVIKITNARRKVAAAKARAGIQ